jgi:hypothetical protein
MKKTSRRNFGKQLTGALAALPVAVLATSPGASAQRKEQAKSRAIRPVDILTSHNTPPPLVIADGSLIVESDQELTESGGGANPFLYTGVGSPDIGHIRVLQDNGDKIYEELEVNTRQIEISWRDEDNNVGGPLIITGGGIHFQIKSDKELKHQPVKKKKRKHEYKHHAGGGTKEIRIESIAITNSRGAKTTFTAAPIVPGAFTPDGFRILIWRH